MMKIPRLSQDQEHDLNNNKEKTHVLLNGSSSSDERGSSEDWLIDWFLVFNATFSNISAISWRPVLVVEEAGVRGVSLVAASRVHPFCNLQSRARTHAVLMIGL